jgi:hypothetical protein
LVEPECVEECDNGDFCDGVETCVEGSCQSGTPIDCNNPPEPQQCYEPEGTCNEENDQCNYTKLDDDEGPSVLDLLVSPPFNNGIFDISAIVEDECSNIQKAEYFLRHAGDLNCGTKGSGTLINASDGAFDELVEDVLAENVEFLQDGSNRVCMRAKDSSGNWGDCECYYYESDTDGPTIVKDFALNGDESPDELLVCDDPTLEVTICDSQSEIQGGEYFFNMWIPPMDIPAPWSGYWLEPDNHYIDEGWHCSDFSEVIDLSELEDGTHYINQIRGKDIVENWGKVYGQNFSYSFIKDTTPPETDKDLDPECGQIAYCKIPEANGHGITDGCYFVRPGTQINLSAIDPDPQGTGEFAGDVVINYKVWWSHDCETDWGVVDSGQSDPDEDVTITLEEDSCHLIEFWAEDACGNEEEHRFELDIVDDTPPEIIKTVGEPKIECNESEECDYYITQDTVITLNCTDREPHPVDKVVLYWRTYLEGETPGDWNAVLGGLAEITMDEDSRHVLEYYCEDALKNSEGSSEEPFREIDIVESVPPIIEKIIEGPSYGNCPPEPCGGELLCEGECYIDGVTEIHVNAYDPEPHPVGLDKCYWWYYVGGERYPSAGVYWDFPIIFPEESVHELYIKCKDKLGNVYEDVEEFIVDKTPPNIIKTYEGPYVEIEDAEYISSDTLVMINIKDPEPHPSGVKYSKYRVSLVDDENCMDQEICQGAEGDDGWILLDDNPLEEVFNIEETSCHLIEVMSVDNVNKTSLHKQCVFVDNSAPEITKEVGEPKYPCEDETCEWYITQETPIIFTCEDVMPHPVDDVTIYIEAYWDFGQGWELIHEWENKSSFTVKNHEDSLHKFIYWCEDALGNRGEVYEEIDNVDTEGPHIIIHNPTLGEAEEIMRCDQSIVVEVWDEKSGVDEAGVYAELYYENGSLARGPVALEKAVYKGVNGSIYEGIMNKELPNGTYILKVYASDNLGNQNMKEMNETLVGGIYVEYLDPVSCMVSMEHGGICIFTFHVCMRDSNAIRFWMDKLGENPRLITPDMLSAIILKSQDSGYVGLLNVSDAEELLLSSEKINGKETFSLSLEVTPEIAFLIGTGLYDLDYEIIAYDP